jgi:hypothetical protein
MQIATLRSMADMDGAQSRRDAMQWFEALARAILLATVVLIGAAVVRNVTDALTTVAAHGHVQTTEQIADR